MRRILIRLYEESPSGRRDPIHRQLSAEILRRLEGIDPEGDYAEPYHLTEIAKELGISRERVRQIAAKANMEIDKLKEELEASYRKNPQDFRLPDY